MEAPNNMLLSYWWRLACLALVSIGVIQILLDALLWLVSPIIARFLEATGIRAKERTFFTTQIATHLLACMLTFFFLVPQYMRRETNLEQERVGILCILIAAAVFARYAHAVVRALTISAQTIRWHRRLGTPLFLPAAEVPVFCVPAHPPLALVGLLSPRIVISKALLKERSLPPAALDVAIAHENSHARNRDNLKLLLLSCLPHLGLKTARRPSVLRQWQSLAELAADYDAVGESPVRAILLAETLLAVARTTSQNPQRIFSAALLPHEEDLQNRINHLLRPTPLTFAQDRPAERLIMMSGAVFVLATAVALFAYVVSLWHLFAECLLHLG